MFHGHKTPECTPGTPAPGQRSQGTPREFNRLVPPPLSDTHVGSTNFVFRSDRRTESRRPISNFGESKYSWVRVPNSAVVAEEGMGVPR